MAPIFLVVINFLAVALVVAVFLCLFRGVPRLNSRRVWWGLFLGVFLVSLGLASSFIAGDPLGDALLMMGKFSLGQQFIPLGYGIIIFVGLVAIKSRFGFIVQRESTTPSSEPTLRDIASNVRFTVFFPIVLALISIFLFLLSYHS